MMARTKGTKTIVTMSLDTDLVRRVDDLADAQGRSRSWLIESWIREQLQGEEMTIKALSNPTVLKALMQAFGNPEVVKAVALAAGGDANPQEMLMFRQGMQLLDNYSDEYRKSLPPEVVAENAMKKTIAANKKAKKGQKKEKRG